MSDEKAKATVAVVEKAKDATVEKSPMEQMRATVQALAPEFKAALPPQIPVERFVRTLITTIQMNPQLLECDRKSVLAATMRSAQDGLLPDGREAAIIIFRTKHGPKAQYIPMVAGVLKKLRNSGEIASVAAHSVHANDFFEYALGDDEKIIHRPVLTGDPGPFIAVYAIVRTKDGGVYREVMSVAEVEKVRAVSKAKDDGPWVTWYEEQAEKSVLKRIAKRCPSSADIESVIDSDNEVAGFVQKAALPASDEPKTIGGSKYLASLTAPKEEPKQEVVDAKTGEVTEREPGADEDEDLPFDKM